MDLRELQELIRLLEESSLQEIEIEEDNRRIRLNKGAPAVQNTYMASAPPVAAAPSAATSSAPALDPVAEEEVPEDDGLLTINSPMIGTFYAASAPGEPRFVSIGDTVNPDQTVCIVEAMKIMNEVPAKVSGIIERLLVENGEPVEFGQPLFAVRPA